MPDDTDEMFGRRLATLAVAAMLVATAFTSVAVAAQDERVAVETRQPTNVTADGAILQGNLTTLENASAATVWVEYWEAGDPANASTTAGRDVATTGPFAIDVQGLEANTTYVVVARAETDDATGIDSETAFTTSTDVRPLGVETAPPSAVTNTSATLEGELTGLGGADTATVWFAYWVAGDRANATTTAGQTLDEPGAFDATVTGLENDTTYVYVAHARIDAVSTASGDAVSFRSSGTVDGVPTWDGEGPFGRWLSSILRNLVPPVSGSPIGQLVVEIVTRTNPGNGHGPPAHAGPPEHAGPPDHGDDEDEEDG